jgi:hypothetical protein
LLIMQHCVAGVAFAARVTAANALKLRSSATATGVLSKKMRSAMTLGEARAGVDNVACWVASVAAPLYFLATCNRFHKKLVPVPQAAASAAHVI